MWEEAHADVRLVNAWERPSIMRKHIVSGAMGMMYFQLVTGMYLVAFGGNIGLEYWHWGVLASLSSLALALQPVSAYMVGRVWNRKSLWYVSAVVARPMRIAAIGAAYGLYGVDDSLARGLFIGLLVGANCFDAISVPPWWCWQVDIIPQEEHGRFMGRRSAWIAVTNVLMVVPIGYVMDRVNGGEGFGALLMVFGIGMVLGILDLWVHSSIPEPPMRAVEDRPFWEEVAAPLLDRGYRGWLVFNTVWTFGLMLGGALAWVYFVDELGIRKAFFGGSLALMVLPMVASGIGGHHLGRMVDRYGVKRTLRWGSWAWAALPLFWVVTEPGSPLMWVWLSAGSLLGGLGVEAAINAGNKLVTRYRPTEQVPMYVAVSTCLAAVAGALGALAAGLVLQGMKGHEWATWGLTFTGFHVIFLASFALRGGATWLIKRIEVPGEA